MRVLWFEVSEPSRFQSQKLPIAGWQDSLENVVRKEPSITLGIAFQVRKELKKTEIEDVTYYPIFVKFNLIEKIKNRLSWKVSRDKLLCEAIKVVKDFKPDIIQVFGSEWCWGQLAKYTKIPLVIHMQGCIPAYHNARFPPAYNDFDVVKSFKFNLKKILGYKLQQKKFLSWKEQEETTLRCASFFMGRTDWDKSLIKVFNPNARYFYCSEVLREDFIHSNKQWSLHRRNKFQILTTGCSTFWKGPDLLIKTAKILCDMGVDFEWKVIGKMNLQKIVEKKERMKFENVNVKIMGFQSAKSVRDMLVESDLYVHTAYIENSPNSICEAQYLGVPVIATYVGGVPSLVENNVNGVLVPSNDPYYLAQKIKDLLFDDDSRIMLSKKARDSSMIRHDNQRILKQLMTCYESLIK